MNSPHRCAASSVNLLSVRHRRRVLWIMNDQRRNWAVTLILTKNLGSNPGENEVRVCAGDSIGMWRVHFVKYDRGLSVKSYNELITVGFSPRAFFRKTPVFNENFKSHAGRRSVIEHGGACFRAVFFITACLKSRWTVRSVCRTWVFFRKALSVSLYRQLYSVVALVFESSSFQDGFPWQLSTGVPNPWHHS